MLGVEKGVNPSKLYTGYPNLSHCGKDLAELRAGASLLFEENDGFIKDYRVSSSVCSLRLWLCGTEP